MNSNYLIHCGSQLLKNYLTNLFTKQDCPNEQWSNKLKNNEQNTIDISLEIVECPFTYGRNTRIKYTVNSTTNYLFVKGVVSHGYAHAKVMSHIGDTNNGNQLPRKHEAPDLSTEMP